MDGNSLDNELIERIPTTFKRNELLEQIDLLLASMHKFDAFELTDIGHYINEKAKASSNQELYLENVKKAVMDLPVVEIIIAISPNYHEILDIVSTVRNTIDPKAIVDLQVDPYIIGGAKISYQGKYYDGSIIAKLENV